MADFSRRFKFGCLGCLGLVLLLVLLGAVVSGIAYLTAEPARIEDRVLTPEIPAIVMAVGVPIGHVILDIRDAELHLVANRTGAPLRIEARYDVNAFSLVEEFTPGTDGDAAWIYRVTFGHGDHGGAFPGLVALARGTTCRVDVFLPVDALLDLTVKIQEGNSVIRLGGLRLRHTKIEFERGGLELSVDEPMREPMESLSIRSVMAGALLNELGNASPRRLDVRYRAGGIDMNLRGRWVRDAEININGRMGGGVVHLPDDVVIEGLDRRSMGSQGDHDPKLPTLTFSVSTGFGGLEFAR